MLSWQKSPISNTIYKRNLITTQDLMPISHSATMPRGVDIYNSMTEIKALLDAERTLMGIQSVSE